MQINHALCNGVFSKGNYESRRSARVYYGSNTKVLLVKRHICAFSLIELSATTGSICVKIMATLSLLIARVVPLEHSNILAMSL